MLIDSDNEDDEEITSKREAFVEEKWFKFTKQDNWNTPSFVRCSKSVFKGKEAPNFVAHGDWRLVHNEIKKEF